MQGFGSDNNKIFCHLRAFSLPQANSKIQKIMSTAAQSQPNSNTRVVQGLEWGVLAAYAVAILSQFPMLYLYAKRLISEPHLSLIHI